MGWPAHIGKVNAQRAIRPPRKSIEQIDGNYALAAAQEY